MTNHADLLGATRDTKPTDLETLVIHHIKPLSRMAGLIADDPDDGALAGEMANYIQNRLEEVGHFLDRYIETVKTT